MRVALFDLHQQWTCIYVYMYVCLHLVPEVDARAWNSEPQRGPASERTNELSLLKT